MRSRNTSQWWLLKSAHFLVTGKDFIDSKSAERALYDTLCNYCFAIFISAVLIASNLPPNGRLISVEFSPENAVIAREIVDIAGLSNKVSFLTSFSIRAPLNITVGGYN
jgi:hypothetical protein